MHHGQHGGQTQGQHPEGMTNNGKRQNGKMQKMQSNKPTQVVSARLGVTTLGMPNKAHAMRALLELEGQSLDRLE